MKYPYYIHTTDTGLRLNAKREKTREGDWRFFFGVWFDNGRCL